MEKNEYITIDELAAYFGKSVRTIRRWEEAGYIPLGVKLFGQEKLWKLAEVDRFVDARFKKMSRSNVAKSVACVSSR